MVTSVHCFFLWRGLHDKNKNYKYLQIVINLSKSFITIVLLKRSAYMYITKASTSMPIELIVILESLSLKQCFSAHVTPFFYHT